MKLPNHELVSFKHNQSILHRPYLKKRQQGGRRGSTIADFETAFFIENQNVKQRKSENISTY
jgi:hypothetical protein